MAVKWWTDALVEQLLQEDAPHGDLTTEALGIGDVPARLSMAMRADATVCGVELAADIFARAGAQADVLTATAARVAAGTPILEAQGEAGPILVAWKVAQTLVEYLSGIATATAAIVDAARAVDPDVAVVTTRKTFPGTKRMMIAAIKAGGALPHRLGLSETLLVFPEHRAFLADPAAAVAALGLAVPEKKVVVEVASLEEARAALAAMPDVLQCEKMTPDDIRAVCALVAGAGQPTVVAAAGGVNAANAADYVSAGARVLVTSAPYWAKPADVKVTISPA
ncbi:ModD protein [Xanthobacter pseudotagetidis]|uniref:ModD protein n=1 Tax=Xanthobacter pseudotagetidis TaxID=3119911 RepID=UPI00372C1785